MSSPIRIAVLISGGGTTLFNLQDRIAAGSLNAEVVAVVASRDCDGATKSESLGMPTTVMSRGSYASVEAYSEAIFEHIRASQPDLVVLAGFLSLIHIPDDYLGRVMNIHPSLIPSFCGQGYFGHKVHEAAIERGVKISGCTVHFADNEYDHGPIILQKAVDVPDGTTPAQLAGLVFEREKEAYPEAIQLFSEGRLKIDGSRVIVTEN